MEAMSALEAARAQREEYRRQRDELASSLNVMEAKVHNIAAILDRWTVDENPAARYPERFSHAINVLVAIGQICED